MSQKSRPKGICFFITPIGEEDSDARKRADQIQKFILKEVLGPKYKIVRADKLPHPGSITHQIIQLLYDADLVVADLTGSNANVAYELAIRHAFNKVSIHLIDKADVIPFDLKDERTIPFDIKDLDSIKGCKDDLRKFSQAISRDKVKYSSPIFRALGVAAATTEEREKFLEDMVDKIDSIATDVSSLDTTITFSDVDQIGSIAEGVEAIRNQHEMLEASIESLESKIQEVLDNLANLAE
ncbi:MAG TPA: hypothetical protein VJS47_01515 [Rhizomicrobium sp.]|nr:hypothetical protein [Rhizomicrobium sp.]